MADATIYRGQQKEPYNKNKEMLSMPVLTDEVSSSVDDSEIGAHSQAEETTVENSNEKQTGPQVEGFDIVDESSTFSQPSILAYSSAMNKPICLCIIWVHLQASVAAEEPFHEQFHRCMVKRRPKPVSEGHRIVCHHCQSGFLAYNQYLDHLKFSQCGLRQQSENKPRLPGQSQNTSNEHIKSLISGKYFGKTNPAPTNNVYQRTSNSDSSRLWINSGRPPQLGPQMQSRKRKFSLTETFYNQISQDYLLHNQQQYTWLSGSGHRYDWPTQVFQPPPHSYTQPFQNKPFMQQLHGQIPYQHYNQISNYFDTNSMMVHPGFQHHLQNQFYPAQPRRHLHNFGPWPQPPPPPTQLCPLPPLIPHYHQTSFSTSGYLPQDSPNQGFNNWMFQKNPQQNDWSVGSSSANKNGPQNKSTFNSSSLVNPLPPPLIEINPGRGQNQNYFSESTTSGKDFSSGPASTFVSKDKNIYDLNLILANEQNLQGNIQGEMVEFAVDSQFTTSQEEEISLATIEIGEATDIEIITAEEGELTSLEGLGSFSHFVGNFDNFVYFNDDTSAGVLDQLHIQEDLIQQAVNVSGVDQEFFIADESTNAGDVPPLVPLYNLNDFSICDQSPQEGENSGPDSTDLTPANCLKEGSEDPVLTSSTHTGLSQLRSFRKISSSQSPMQRRDPGTLSTKGSLRCKALTLDGDTVTLNYPLDDRPDNLFDEMAASESLLLLSESGEVTKGSGLMVYLWKKVMDHDGSS